MYMQLKTLLTIVQHEPEVIGCLLLTNTLKTFISFYFEFYVSQIKSEMQKFVKLEFPPNVQTNIQRYCNLPDPANILSDVSFQ